MNLTFQIPHSEVTDFASLLDSIKKHVTTMPLGLDNILTHGPVNSVSIIVRPPNFDENRPKDMFVVDVTYDPVRPKADEL